MIFVILLIIVVILLTLSIYFKYMENNINSNQPSTSRSGVQDFFLYLFSIICLYVSSVSFISLMYAIINKYFPDNLYNYSSFSSAKWAIASLIIFFPVFILLSWVINKSIIKFPEIANLGIRKVLYYFTLFVAGLAVAIDLVTLIFYFLDGEISLRFILKVLSVLVVGSLVFGYYLYDLRRNVTQISNTPKIMAIIVSIIVLIVLVFGFVIFGSPALARKIKFDNQRTSDLLNIQNAVTDYYRANNNVLPKNLDILSQGTSYYLSGVKDPETAVKYEYQIVSQNQYKLCANFSLDSSVQDRNNYVYPASENFTHGVGRVCFDRTAGEIPLKPSQVPGILQ